jgi:hypothetical protein
VRLLSEQVLKEYERWLGRPRSRSTATSASAGRAACCRPVDRRPGKRTRRSDIAHGESPFGAARRVADRLRVFRTSYQGIVRFTSRGGRSIHPTSVHQIGTDSSQGAEHHGIPSRNNSGRRPHLRPSASRRRLPLLSARSTCTLECAACAGKRAEQARRVERIRASRPAPTLTAANSGSVAKQVSRSRRSISMRASSKPGIGVSRIPFRGSSWASA